jgi:hypothetical protein
LSDIAGIDQKLDTIDRRLNTIDNRIDDLVKDVETINKAIKSAGTEFERFIKFVDKKENVKTWETAPRIIKGLYYLPRAVFGLVTLVYVAVFGYVFLAFPLSANEALLAIVIATIALALQVLTTLKEWINWGKAETITDYLADWNFRRLKNNDQVKGNFPLLRALILLRVTEPNCELNELMAKYPRLVTEEKVVAKLYGLQVTGYYKDNNQFN